MKKKITIAYRVYPKITRPTNFCRHNKFRFIKKNFNSLIESLGSLNFKLFIIIDNCPTPYRIFFEKFKSNFDIEIIELKTRNGNIKTFLMQIRLLKEANSDYIFFLEDDYFFLKNSIPKILDFMNKFKIDFVTPFYSKDYDNLKIHNYHKQKIFYKNLQWAKVASTTLTFIANKKSFKKNMSIFETFKYNNYDSSIWLSITKLRPKIKLLDFFQKKILKIFTKLFLFQYFSNKNSFNLYVPCKSFSTHIDQNDKFIKKNLILKKNLYEELSKY